MIHVEEALQVMLSDPTSLPETSTGVLNSWKEISRYLGRGVRTAQRYEMELGFPVHRLSGKNRSSVVGFKDEIDGWLRSTPKKVFMLAEKVDCATNVEADLEKATAALEEAYAAYQLCLARYIEVKKTVEPPARAFKASV